MQAKADLICQGDLQGGTRLYDLSVEDKPTICLPSPLKSQWYILFNSGIMPVHNRYRV